MDEFSFSFFPKKLVSATEKIKKNFPSRQELESIKQSKYQESNIEELIDEINEVKLKDVKSYAGNLKNKEVHILTYNYNEIPESLREKVNIILNRRMKRSIIKIMWNNFTKSPRSYHIKKFFENGLDILQRFKFYECPYELLTKIFKEGQPIKWIVDYIISLELPYQECLNHLDLSLESNLSQEIISKLFIKANKSFFEQEKNEFLVKIFSFLEVSSLIKIAENYLQVFKTGELETTIMELFKEKFGDPTEEYSKSWIKMSDVAHEKAQKWFNKKALADFSANIEGNSEEAERRFKYWEKYLNDLEKVRFIETRLQLFLIFKNLVVIEFGEKGNAAYIYKKNIFEENYAKYMKKKNAIENIILKNRSLAEDRIIHSGRWEYKTDHKIKQFLE